MAKVISKYSLFTATMIEARASDVGDSVVNGDNVEYTNITMTKLGNATANTSRSLKEIHDSSNVNEWSYFGAYTHSTDTYDIVNTLKSPAKMGNFAGYDHNAASPYIEVPEGENPYVISIWEGEDLPDDVNIHPQVHLGQLDYKTMNNGGTIKVSIMDGTTLIKSGEVSDYENDMTWSVINNRDIAGEVAVTGINAESKTYTLKAESIGSVFNCELDSIPWTLDIQYKTVTIAEDWVDSTCSDTGEFTNLSVVKGTSDFIWSFDSIYIYGDTASCGCNSDTQDGNGYYPYQCIYELRAKWNGNTQVIIGPDAPDYSSAGQCDEYGIDNNGGNGYSSSLPSSWDIQDKDTVTFEVTVLHHN